MQYLLSEEEYNTLIKNSVSLDKFDLIVCKILKVTKK